MTYKLIQSSKGDKWMKDGRFVSAKDVPDEVKLSQNKQCIICQEEGGHKRVVLGMTLELCSGHYYDSRCTYGYLAGLLKKKGIYGKQGTPVGSPA